MWQFFYLKIFRNLIWSDTYIFVKVVSVLLLMIALFTAVFYIYEDNVTLWDSLWTAYVSLTTVGYGDFAAKSWQGRVVTVLVTFLGIGSLPRSILPLGADRSEGGRSVGVPEGAGARRVRPVRRGAPPPPPSPG